MIGKQNEERHIQEKREQIKRQGGGDWKRDGGCGGEEQDFFLFGDRRWLLSRTNQTPQFAPILCREEREQVFIATAKGRNGPKSPYTQLRATKKSMYRIEVIYI